MQLQQEITRQIHQVLQVEDVMIEAQDNLIEHGLHSLAIMQLVDHFEKKYNKPLSYADFAMSPTVQDWHDLIQDTAQQAAEVAVDHHTHDIPAWLKKLPTATVPLSDMQYAYWAGRETEGVAAHLYMEFEGEHLDPAALQQAFQQLIQRHPMLSVCIRDGMQGIKSLEHQHLEIEDLSHLGATALSDYLSQKRQRLSHQYLNIAEGHVLNVQLSLLPGHRHRLHIDSDMSAIDPQSFLILIEDLTALYQGVAALVLDFDQPEYFNYLEQRRHDPAFQAQQQHDQRWWQQQLEYIAPVPQLPLIAEGLRADEHQFERLIHIFNQDECLCLKNLAQTHGISVGHLCLTLFAHTVASWSSSAEFRLNLPAFIREPYAANIHQVVGDFTQMSLLSLKLSAQETLLEAVKRIERDVAQVTKHYRYGGIHVLRDLSKQRQQLEISPIVFTLALEEGEIFSAPLQETLGRPIWCISQGPKVNLDVQVAYMNQSLVVNWDIRSHAFQPHVIEAMFKHYIAAIQQLISDGQQVLTQAFKFELPKQQRAARLKQQATLPAPCLAQLPQIDAHTPYRIVNGLGADCPDWVVGQLLLQQQDNAQWAKEGQIALAESWTDTGMQAYFDDQGRLHVVEHAYRVLTRNGYRVEVEEIEKRLLQITALRQVQVYAIEIEQKVQLVALVEFEQPLSALALQEAYRQVLPQYLRPEHSYAVDHLHAFGASTVADDIHHFIETHLSIEQHASQQSTAAHPVEQVVRFMMSQIIGLALQSDQTDLDFFDEGGDSLLATHLVAALNQYFKGCEINVVDIFTQRSVKNLAQLIEQKIPDNAQRIAAVFLQVINGK